MNEVGYDSFDFLNHQFKTTAFNKHSYGNGGKVVMVFECLKKIYI